MVQKRNRVPCSQDRGSGVRGVNGFKMHLRERRHRTSCLEEGVK